MDFNVMTLVAKITADTTEFYKACNGVEGKAKSLGGKVASLGVTGLWKAAKTGAAALTTTTGATAAFAKTAVSAGQSFDSSMSQVAATMGKTVDEIQDLRNFAMQMGATTAFSATEAAQALNYMALAGYDSQTSMKMLPNVLNLAAAGGMSLATASDMVTDAQSALGLSIEDTESMVDQMAKASSKTNTSVSQLGDAILTIGATARNVRGGTVELSQVLGVLADNGIKGSEGGTHLRNVLLSLQTPTDKGVAALKELGMTYDDMYDESGKMRSLPEIFLQMQSAMEGMTDQARDAIISGIFNKTDLASVNALIGTSNDRWNELESSIASAGVSVNSLGNKLQESGLPSMEKMKKNMEGLGVDGEQFDAILQASRGSADTFADALYECALAAKNGNVEFEDVANALGGDMESLSNAFENASGAAEAMAGTQLDNLSGAMTLYKSALEGVQIAVSDQLTPSITEFVRVGTQGLSDFALAFQEGGLDAAMGAFGGLITDGISFLINQLPALFDAGAKVLDAILNGITQSIPQIAVAGSKVIATFLNSVMTNIPVITNIAGAALSELATGISKELPQLVPVAVETVMKFVEALIDNLPLLTEGALNLAMGLAEGLVLSIPKIVMKIPDIIEAIIKALFGYDDEMIKAGANLIAGVAKGILDGAVNVINTAKKVAANVLGAIKGFFGIASPSKVMRVEVGRQLGEGMVLGLQDEHPAIKSAAKQITELAAAESEMSASVYTPKREPVITATDNGRIENLLITIIESIQSMGVTLDSETLVGYIAPKMDKELGFISNNRIREVAYV